MSSPGFISTDDQELKHGTVAPTFAEYWTELCSRIERCDGHNSVVSCLSPFTEGLGERRSKDRLNPLGYYASWPIAGFQFRDKVIGRSPRDRTIPISSDIGELLVACEEMLSGFLILPFVEEGEVKPFSDLRHPAKIDPRPSWAGCKCPGRTAFFNMLRHEGAGEALTEYLMGHGNSISQPNSFTNIASLKQQAEQAKDLMFMVYEKYGIDETAGLLAAKLRACVDASVCARARKNPVFAQITSLHRVGEIEDDRFIQGLRPLSVAEQTALDCVDEVLMKPLDNGQLLPAGVGANRLGLGILLALTKGIPIDNLLKMLPYYTSEIFVIDRNSNNYYFNAIGEHSDLGPLFILPLFLCSNAQSDSDTILKLFRKLYDRGESFPWPESVTREELGFAFRHLLVEALRRRYGNSAATRSTLTDLEAYTLLSRLSQFRCRYLYPGPVLAGLQRGNRYGLNHVTLENFLHLLNGVKPDLYSVGNGQPYTDRWAFDPGLQADLRKRLLTLLRKPGNESPTQRDIEAALLTVRIAPGKRVFKTLLEQLHVPEHQIKGLVIRLMAFCRKAGLFRTSQGLCFPTSSESEEIIHRVNHHFTELRDKYDDQSLTHAKLTFLIYYVAGLRLSELSDENGFRLFRVGSRILVYIKRGKSGGARRWIDFKFVSPPKGLLDEIHALLDKLDEFQPQSSHPAFVDLELLTVSIDAAAKRGAAICRSVLGNESTLHDLRHIFFRDGIQRAIDRTYHTGNFNSTCCHLAIVGGHRSLGVGQRAYLGTIIMTLRFPPAPWKSDKTKPVPRDMALRLSKASQLFHFRSQRELEKRLQDECSGRASYQSILETGTRRILSRLTNGASKDLRVRFEGPKNTIPVDDGFFCPFPKPRADCTALWERACIRMAEEVLSRGRSILIPPYSDSRAFQNKLKRLERHYRANQRLRDH